MDRIIYIVGVVVVVLAVLHFSGFANIRRQQLCPRTRSWSMRTRVHLRYQSDWKQRNTNFVCG